MTIREHLPTEYIDNMRKVPGLELDAFLAIYDYPPVKALRFNTRKVRPETIAKLVKAWSLEPVPWCKDAYYYEETDILRPGLSPYHDAGVYYIQEPSAMITAEKADIKPGEYVLDLCAAPGGKSTQAAAKAGLLISNEPIPNRARILSSNIERMGFDNCIVSSAYPDELAKAFDEFFDKIIVDAPCSGEGMMRKDETARTEWSPANVAQCIVRQREILDAAAGMLKPGGRLVYSTCTFEYGENEGQIKDFLARHNDYRLLESETLYPHIIRGEGHYCAVLEKLGTAAGSSYTDELIIGGKHVTGGDNQPELAAICNQQSDASENYNQAEFKSYNQRQETQKKRTKGKKLNLKSSTPLTLKELSAYMQKSKLHVLRTGVEPGETITDRRGSKRYEPSHAEALSGTYGSLKSDSINLLNESDALSYLKGNVIELDKLDEGTFELNSKGGWLTVMYDGYPMGLGKLTGRIIKNHYPKGLRHLQ